MQEVFDKIKFKLEEHFNSTDNRDMRLAYHHAIKIVNEVEKEYVSGINDENNGWIPCSDRLPEDLTEVLVCKQDGVLDFDMYEYQYEDWSYNSKNHKNTVIAWKKLPEPYKEVQYGIHSKCRDTETL